MARKTRSGAISTGLEAAESHENGPFAGVEGEFIKAAIGLSGGSFGAEAKAAIPTLTAYIRTQGPVVHSVLASWFEGKSHFAVLEFQNLSANGAYIESLEMLAATDEVDFMVSPMEDRGTPSAYWKKRSSALPLLVPAQGTLRLALRFTDDAAGSLGNADTVKLAYDLRPANGAASCRKELVIALRRSGPPFGRIS